jgi:integrase/recombinase XerD
MKTEETLSNFLAHCRAKNLKASTITWYGDKLRPFAALYPRLPVNPEAIEGFLAGIKGSAHTKHAAYRSLRAFYNFVTQRSRRRTNPMDKVSAPRCPRIVMPTLEPTELMQLLFHSTLNARDRALLTLLVDSAARAIEIATLRWQDIGTDTIMVTGKSGQRVIPISEETKRLLLGLKQPGSVLVFAGQRGPLTRYGIYHIISRCMREAGITGPKLGSHRLRHTFGRSYLVAGGDLRSLQVIMGHRNISTTLKYASLTQGEITMKHHKYTPLRVAHAAIQERLFKEVEEVMQR